MLLASLVKTELQSSYGMVIFSCLPASMMISPFLKAESLPSWVETKLPASWKTS